MNKLILVITLALISEIKSEDVENGTKIVGGDLIEISAVPYQASLSYDGKFICGASIISTKYLLSAAHCMWGKKFNSFYRIRGYQI
jgi:secreted trypsin-like serine protease